MKILLVSSIVFGTILLSAGSLLAQLDFGDLPDPAYPTKLASNGARHIISPNLFMGVVPDDEADGFATANAQGDDASFVDDEDGIDPTLLHPHSGFPITFPVKVTNNTPIQATLYGYVDWNQDGDFVDASEFASVTVPGGTINGIANLVFNVPFNSVVTSMTPVRLRFTSNQTPPGVVGQMPDGEVEDFFVAVTQLFDFGDLPDAMVGTAPGTLGTGTPPDYQTMKIDGGPFHAMRQDLNFFNDSGSADAHIDAEPDGQPSPNAQGDDLNGDDDERVLTHTVTGSTVIGFGSAAKVQVNLSTSLGIQNTTGVPAKVIGFIDANSDGDFNDVGESSAIIVPGNGSVTTANLPFTFTFVPPYPTATFTKIFALRYRISTDMVLPPNGGATDGEVHDELISAQFDINYPLPPDFGDLPAPYATLMADNGPRHTPTAALFMGTNATDAEVEGLPHATANGDDADATDDEDGFIPASVTFYKGAPFSLPVKATNTTGADAYIRAFADWNQDGDFADANEIATKTVPAGTVATVLTLPWSVPFHVNTALPVALRLRLSPNPALPQNGAAVSGEVEDYLVQVQTRLDFGDLPAPYATIIADGGPSHVIRDGLSFDNDTGSADADVDAESDGQPSTNASADNTNGDDDELGLLLSVTRQVGSGYGASTILEVDLMSSLAVENTTGVKANAVFFIDANSDGDFTDAGESVTTTVAGDGSVHAVTQMHTFSFTAPYPATSFSKTFAMRFRITTDTTVPPVGPASDGEVHDQFVTINFNVTYASLPDFGDLPAPYPTLVADNGARHTLTPTLHLGALPPDAEINGQPQTLAQGDDASSLDDEDGFNPASVTIARGQTLQFPVTVTNLTGSVAFLRAFADWNQDGDFLDTSEVLTLPVPMGSPNITYTVAWSVPFAIPTSSTVALRLRLSSNPALGPNGAASEGEVEDYMVQVTEQLDFGDLQDSATGLQPSVITNGSTTSIGDFQTRLADNGARHVMRQDLAIIIEAATYVTDAETDGHPSPDASGDDLDGTADDEESAFFGLARQIATFPTFPSRPAKLHLSFEILASLALRNETGGDAYLTAFIDGNSDGDFADAGETQVKVIPHSSTYTISEFTALPYSIDVSEPIDSGTLKIPVRFRLSTQAGLGASGLAADGEVEDYVVVFSWAASNYWEPNTPSISTQHHDIGLPSRLKGSLLGTKPIKPGSSRWHFGSHTFIGDHITLTPAQLQGIGTGRHWLSQTVVYADGSLGSYLSQVQITDLPGYRSSLQGQGLTGENAAPDADPDGDGYENFLEHALGSHPNIHGDRPPLLTAPESPAPGSKLTLTYLRRTGGSSSGANYNTGEISYCPQGSTTLNTWDTPMEVPAAPPAGLPTPPPGYEWGTARLNAPMTGSATGFMRLCITPPTP